MKYTVRSRVVRLAAIVICGLALFFNVAHGFDGAVVTYSQGDSLYRQAVESGSTPEDLAVALDAVAARAPDLQVNISPDAAWLVFSTERFDLLQCGGWACLAVVAADFSSGAAIVTSDGSVIHNDAQLAIASGGNLVVYDSQDGPNGLDLFAVTRGPANWGTAVTLTSSSPHAFNSQPAISADGLRVVFDCGPVQYGQTGTGVCEVGTDGSGFRQVLMPGDPSAPTNTTAFHHPDYAPDGAIIVEGDVDGTESIWRIEGANAAQLAETYSNDNSPCVLPGGRIASLWLGRVGNPEGLHELKVTSSDGADLVMLTPGVDVVDVGLGCGAPHLFIDGFDVGDTSSWSSVAAGRAPGAS